jgi:DnaJ-class molecular chaperone
LFPLVGLHATQPCTACHRNGVYRGTPRDCFSCHQANYNQTTNPNHVAAGFPTTCDSCHKATDAAWTQGTFAHTAFPITGRHNATCSTCHTNPTNYRVFTCLTCHDRATTDSHHQGRSGYLYDSQACYTCHPRGSAG